LKHGGGRDVRDEAASAQTAREGEEEKERHRMNKNQRIHHGSYRLH
jgi:hypothetical protein